ncbi:MAG TPA: DUF4349 domain-containing protein [Candidatus Polarisedimenticolaceae bacterium]|nr:DUF4349 domain-containing protein [Candidatus Polarisedimenticolaceae bacterium]
MKTRLALVLVVIGFAAMACNRSAPLLARRQADMALEAKDVGRLASLGYIGAAAAPPPRDAAKSSGSPDPMLAMTGGLKLEVKDVESAAREVQVLADGAGGFIGNANAGRNVNGTPFATLAMRIPTKRVSSTLESLRALGKVTLETVTTEDVSKSYFDLATRLRAKRGTEERLHGILATRTGKLSDVIDAEKELERVVGEIEEIEGTQHFYEGRVAMATLTVELMPTDTTPAPSRFAAIGRALHDAEDTFLTSVAGTIYFLACIIPWLVIATLGFLLVKWARVRMRRTA